MPRLTRRKTTNKMSPRRRSTPSLPRRTHPCIEAGNAALQPLEGYLPDVRLLGTNYMLYGFYQDWVHQNPGDHSDGGIAEDSKWKSR